ncbi:MAG TPA: LysR family transcriptional regulator [Pseudolabrys sp.]|nr:LysR family transcriptional regulator [Pseudolabrys sp.]
MSTADSVRTANRRLRINFNQLEYAIAAADHGSFRQAAEALSVKQSTLSRSIQILEHGFGVAIFERSTGGVRATSIGRHFLRTARSIVEQLETLNTVAKASGRGEAGRLVVGFCTSLTTGNLRAALLDFKGRFPQVELGTIERSTTKLVTALRNGVVDLHIATGEKPFDCKAIPLWSERILVALPIDHPLATREVFYWTDLRNQTLLLSQYDPGTELEALLNTKLNTSRDRPRIERHDVSRGAIKSLISMGIGVSLVLESDTGANLSGITYRKLQDGTGPSRIDFSAMWREDNENPALANFLRLLSERYPFLPEG